MISNALRVVLSVAFLSTAVGCASPAATDSEVVGDDTQALSKSRTFSVSRTKDGCTFPYQTLYVRRGGTMTLRNDGAMPLLAFVDWPNALGEDGGEMIELQPGESEKVDVPYLDAELYGDGRSLEFPVYCGDPSENVWALDADNEVRIYR